jgi:predicted nucleic acid-binding protein
MDSKIVVDTSVIIKWLNQTNEKNIDIVDKLMEDALKGGIEIFAPELAKYELGNVLLKGKQLVPKEAYISLSTVYSLPIHFVAESEDAARETYRLAFNLGITYYDASFMALAKQYNATLITDNIKHQSEPVEIKVKPLQDY